MRYFALLVLFALTGWWFPSLAAAEEPAGIVMAISGETDPPLTAMAEISDGSRISLKGDARLTFLHYSLCKIAVVTGGTVTLSRANFVSDGRIESEKDEPCPRVYSMLDMSETNRSTGGALIRGGAMTPPHWSASAEFIFTGAKANLITAAVIISDDSPAQPMQLQIVDGRGRQPAGAAPLKPDGHYTLRISTRDRSTPTVMPFISAAPSASGALVVLRLS
jgi:hypothetical protein